MTVTPARLAALETLRAVRRGELADRALLRTLERVSARERGWTQELVYGTFRLRGRLDLMLAPHVRAGLDRLEPDVLDVLRLGAYQLLEMNSVPVYAAVSQSVELTRGAGHPRAAGLVNGVLQSLRREPGRAHVPTLSANAVERLTGWGSHPRWLVERWIARLGPASAEALVEANNRRPELYLRLVGAGVNEALTMLERAGVTAEAVAAAPHAVRLVEGSIGDALGAVPAIVQDPAAGAVVRFVDAPPESRVIDLCAAPGGKAIGMAAGDGAGRRPGSVLALDVSPARVRRLAENARRLGDLPMAVAVGDARRPAASPADVVLLDAPCTGTGTLRRHPDGKWRIGPEDLRALVALQRELLAGAATVVKPGGLLVYATCSLEAEENEDQVDSFLAANAEFVLEAGSMEPAFMDDMGRLRVEPQRTGWDGAFAARLRRAR